MTQDEEENNPHYNYMESTYRRREKPAIDARQGQGTYTDDHYGDDVRIAPWRTDGAS